MPRICIYRHALRRNGTVTVLVAVLLVAIFGIVAFALDGGLLLDNRRKVQGACDAAAMGAANQLFVNYPAIVASDYEINDPYGAGRSAALSYAAANGFPNNGTQSVVTVHIPPQSGTFAGRTGYVEVLLTYYQKRMFSRMWDSAPMPVKARSVARGQWIGSGKGIIVLDPSARSVLNASGNASMTVTGGGSVVVNSNNSQAAVVTGNGLITALLFEITGGYSGTLNGIVETEVPGQPDPLRYLPVPSVPPDGVMTTVNLGHGNKRYTLTPGRYANLPLFNSGDEVILKQASANSAGGIYYIDGGGLKSTGATITLDPNTSGGVMIYNDPSSSAQSQQIQITGNSSGSVNLSALTNGPYAGILLWQDRAASQSISVEGNGSFNLLGTFYAANAELKIAGNGNAVIGSQYIGRSVDLSGNGNITINYSAEGTARIRESTLVE